MNSPQKNGSIGLIKMSGNDVILILRGQLTEITAPTPDADNQIPNDSPDGLWHPTKYPGPSY